MTKSIQLRSNDKGLRAFLSAVSFQLRGKRISRARRSVGSILLLDFGALLKIRSGDKVRSFGEWHLLVEMAPWTISKGKRILLTSGAPPSKIDKLVSPLLKGKLLEQFTVRQSGHMEMNFADNTKLNIKKQYSERYNNNWTLFYKGYWSISNADEKNRYQIQFGNSKK